MPWCACYFDEAGNFVLTIHNSEVDAYKAMLDITNTLHLLDEDMEDIVDDLVTNPKLLTEPDDKERKDQDLAVDRNFWRTIHTTKNDREFCDEVKALLDDTEFQENGRYEVCEKPISQPAPHPIWNPPTTTTTTMATKKRKQSH